MDTHIQTKVIAVAALLGLVASIPLGLYLGDRRGARPANMAGENALSADPQAYAFSALSKLGHAHEEMVLRGGGLVTGTVTELESTDGRAALTLDITEILWSTVEFEVEVGQQAQASADLSTADEELIGGGTVLGGNIVAALSSDGVLLGLAVLEEFNAATDQTTDGLVFLGAAAGVLRENPSYSPVPQFGGCPSHEQNATADSDVDALAGYFQALGDMTRKDRMANEIETESHADSMLLAAGSRRDAVTGEWVEASLNHILRQLRSGVADAEVEIVYDVPLIVTLPLKSDSLDADMIQVIDAVTEQPLGAFDLSPIGAHYDDAGSESESTFTVYTQPSPPGHAVALYLRRIEDRLFGCPPTADEEPVFTIAYDTFAGSRRAHVDLNRMSVQALDAESYASLTSQ